MAIDQSFHPTCCNRKVKLLCRFGGKFLHRPYDWKLRYAGGHLRITVVPRDITLPQLCRKLSHVFGAPVAIRYQLPNQEIDSLVSVYSEEDLEYMMEEFDKIAQPSAKLHVFLFTQSEISSFLAPSELTLIDLCDGGREYFEAVKATFSSSHAAAIHSSQICSPKATHNSNSNIPYSPAIGNLDPLSEEDQFGGSIVHPLSHPIHKVFHLSLSEIAPLQPCNLPPPSIEPYGLHPLPPFNHMDCNLGSIVEKIDHSKQRNPLCALGLSEDTTEESYGLFVYSPQSLLDCSCRQQRKQILDGDHFHAAKQQNVISAEGGDHIQVLHPFDPVGLSSISYDVLELLSHPQGYVKQAEGINDDLIAFVEEGTLPPLVDCLIKESHYPFLDFGEYYIYKDMHDHAQRLRELLQDILKCCESYSTFAEFKQDEGVPFAVIFGLGMEHEDKDSRRIQQDIFIKFMSYVFERNVLTYLLNILQNYVFDPGGD